MGKEVYTVSQALEKGMRYCAYQERCQSEVRKKISTFELTELEVETVIFELIQQNFLNEERFATSYAVGKFRQNKWGKRKIELGLRSKEVSEPCIRIGLDAIESEEYEEAIKNLAEKTLAKNSALDTFKREAKTAQYLIGKGFETDLVWSLIKEVQHD